MGKGTKWGRSLGCVLVWDCIITHLCPGEIVKKPVWFSSHGENVESFFVSQHACLDTGQRGEKQKQENYSVRKHPMKLQPGVLAVQFAK